MVNASNREKDWNHFQEQAKAFDVQLEDETNEVAMIAFQGPLSGRILTRVKRDGTMPETFRNSLSKITILGTEVLVARDRLHRRTTGILNFLFRQERQRLSGRELKKKVRTKEWLL